MKTKQKKEEDENKMEDENKIRKTKSKWRKRGRRK